MLPKSVTTTPKQFETTWCFGKDRQLAGGAGDLQSATVSFLGFLKWSFLVVWQRAQLWTTCIAKSFVSRACKLPACFGFFSRLPPGRSAWPAHFLVSPAIIEIEISLGMALSKPCMAIPFQQDFAAKDSVSKLAQNCGKTEVLLLAE